MEKEGDRGIVDVESPSVVVSWGLHSLRFGTQRKSRIWGTENEFKCLWHIQVEMPDGKLDAWVWKLIRLGL